MIFNTYLEGAFKDDLSECLTVHFPQGALCYCLIINGIFVCLLKSADTNSSKNLYSGRPWLVVQQRKLTKVALAIIFVHLQSQLCEVAICKSQFKNVLKKPSTMAPPPWP